MNEGGGGQNGNLSAIRLSVSSTPLARGPARVNGTMEI